MLERFNRWPLIKTKEHLEYFERDDRFWELMQTALLKHDVVLKSSMVNLVVCEHFLDGIYLPAKEEIMLCANALTNEVDFQNGI